jgi:hypothetical protein
MSIDENFRRLNDGENWSGLELQPRQVEPRRRRAPLLLQVAVVGVVGIAVGVAVTLGVSGIRSQNVAVQPSPRPTATATASAAPTPTSTLSARPAVPGEYLDADGVRATWLWDVQHFERELPDGYAFPLVPPDGFLRPGEGYEGGITGITIAMYFRCAWESTYLTALIDGESADADRALEEIRAYGRLDIVVSNFPDYEPWYELVIEPSLDGDTAELRTDVASCGGILFAMLEAAG